MKRVLRPLSLATAVWLACGASFADNLQEIYELSLKNDAQLKIAEASYRANIETEKQARSRLLPQVQADASYTDSDNEQSNYSIFSGAPGRLGTDADTQTTAWGIGLNQPLFDLPAWFTFQSGKELTRQAEAQLAADQQALITRVALVYFNVLRETDNLRASKAEELATKRQLDQTQQRFDVGLIAITDVHEARAAYDAIVAQRLADEGNLATAYEAISILTGQPHANLWQLTEQFPVVDPQPVDRAQWVQFALDNNYSLQAARYASEASRQNATSKRMEHAPKVNASLGYRDSDSDGTQDISVNGTPIPGGSLPGDAGSTQQTAMVELRVPIFTGGYVSSQRRQAAEQYNGALQQRIETERQVVQTTRARHIATMTDVQRVKARSQSIVSAQSAVDATQAGYEVGTRNVVDVLQAQRVLYAAMRDYANARYDYVIDFLRLKQLAGTLSPQDILDLNKWLQVPEAPTANTP